MEKSFNYVDVQPYNSCDQTDHEDTLLKDAQENFIIDEQPIIVYEVGGYFYEPFIRMPHNFAKYLIGVVEVTTFGDILNTFER